MSVAQRTMAELRREVDSLSLTWPTHQRHPHKEPTKAQVVKVLQTHFLNKLYGTSVPKPLQLMLSLDTPMLCCQFREISSTTDIWNNPHWIAEEKLDGVRMMAMFTQEERPHPDVQGASYKVLEEAFYSRSLSVKNFLPVNYWGNIWLGSDYDRTKITDEFILDSELISDNPSISTIIERRHGGVVTVTMLQAVTALLSLNPKDSMKIQEETGRLVFCGFDILYWNGVWVMDKPYHYRRKLLLKARDQLLAAGLNFRLPRMSHKFKKQFAAKVLSEGGEGIILKNINASYMPTQSRAHRQWVKFKRSVSQSRQDAGGSDTFEGWISGFEPAKDTKGLSGLVGSLNISVYLVDDQGNEREHVVARVANIELDLRKKMTITLPNGSIGLHPDYYGQVVEIDGQDISARALRFSHARLIRFRPDRSQDTCTIEEAFLRSLVL